MPPIKFIVPSGAHTLRLQDLNVNLDFTRMHACQNLLVNTVTFPPLNFEKEDAFIGHEKQPKSSKKSRWLTQVEDDWSEDEKHTTINPH